ncbi:hypothetical protein CAPTEDRAFT_206058 [Capitella teleta]|uniref:DDE Tnp4 domain-containing protein n=1 Tax=Capitella teleta TaxID=283909 RepID=R7UZK1_CAPTE|nr:hypothetical protein CAPTEDRAFT_206058 [Capitella teleta]|eukprot:ELU08871.1 hypothetical protein CAPTEDRAFT_206058 [Capitella teleta]
MPVDVVLGSLNDETSQDLCDYVQNLHGRSRYHRGTAGFQLQIIARRTVSENAFGQVASRWRIFHTKLAVAKTIAKASCLLHNCMRLDGNIPEDGEYKSDNIFAELDPWRLGE